MPSSYDAPRLHASFRCILSVGPGDRPPVPSMPAAVSYGSDVALDRQRHAPWRDASHIVQAAEIPRHLAVVLGVVSLST
jgi:hypothetical protein